MVEPQAPVVDTHAHVFTRAMPFAPGAHSRPNYDYPVATYLTDLDRQGITYGVLAAASLFDDGNAYTLAALAVYPRLRGTVIAPPDTSLSVLRKLAEMGVVGVRLVWRRLREPPPLDAEPYRSFLRRLADCGLHVELLAGATQLAVLLPQLAISPAHIVVDHFGVPSHDPIERRMGIDALLRAVDAGRTWIKISAGFRIPFDIATEVTDRLLSEAGTSRLLWGSDAPFVNHEGEVHYIDTLDLYRRLVPDAATRAAIDRTALALFFNEETKHEPQ